MAIKPITNDNAGYESRTNREAQTSIRSEKGNPKVVIKKPGGQNAGKGFSIGLREIDTAVIKHIRNIMKPKVKEQNEIISVPVLYGNEERWKSIKNRGTLRDKNGSLILPMIVIKRTAVGFDDSFTESGADIGVTLTAALDDKDSTAGNETVAFKFTTTSTGTDATIDYQTTILA